jgi:F0F1-type ATP synthase membrane subunit b/b'
VGKDTLNEELVRAILHSGSDEARLLLSEAQKLERRIREVVAEANGAMSEAIETAIKDARYDVDRQIVRLGKRVLRRKSRLPRV